MHPPTQTERQALLAALDAIGDAAPDPIVLTPAPHSQWADATTPGGISGSTYGHVGKMRHALTGYYYQQQDQPGRQWFVVTRLVDQLERLWERCYHAVIDDFGNLVEVPRCQ